MSGHTYLKKTVFARHTEFHVMWVLGPGFFSMFLYHFQECRRIRRLTTSVGVAPHNIDKAYSVVVLLRRSQSASPPLIRVNEGEGFQISVPLN